MGHAFHVFDVVGEPAEREEAKQAEHFHGRLLAADEFGFDFFETEMPGEVDDFTHERAGQAASTELRVDEHADSSDVPLPAAELLVKRG